MFNTSTALCTVIFISRISQKVAEVQCPKIGDPKLRYLPETFTKWRWDGTAVMHGSTDRVPGGKNCQKNLAHNVIYIRPLLARQFQQQRWEHFYKKYTLGPIVFTGIGHYFLTMLEGYGSTL